MCEVWFNYIYAYTSPLPKVGVKGNSINGKVMVHKIDGRNRTIDRPSGIETTNPIGIRFSWMMIKSEF